MKVIKYVFLGALVLVLATSCNNSRVFKKSLETEVDSASYALGLNAGLQLSENFEEMDVDLFFQGFQNGVDSTEFLVETKEIKPFLNKFFKKLQQETRAKKQAEALKKKEVEFAEVKVASINFLDENKDKEGVITTESGLQYIVLKEGNGKKPLSTDIVKVLYEGKLIDGTLFDSALNKDKPAEFGVNRVIKGWTEGLQLMSEGSKFKFFIPEDIAYGANPRRGGKIRPFDALVFEVELLEVIKSNKPE